MKNPVTIGMYDTNDFVCIITVEKENVEKAFESIDEGWSMWYSGAYEEDEYEDEVEYPEGWDEEDWNKDELYNAGYNEPVYYLLKKRNIEYIEEDDMMAECEESDNLDIFGDKVIWR